MIHIALDSAGNAYVAGSTDSGNFPQTNALTMTSLGIIEGFASKLNAQGSQLLFSTYLAGQGFDEVADIAIDTLGSMYVVGYTDSEDFPAAGGLRRAYQGNYDGFIVKIDDSALAAPRVRTTTYSYDGLLRLTRASENPGTVYSYTYDLAGNRTQAWQNGVLQQGRSYNAANQVVGYTYDAAGNLLNDGTTSYLYDALSRPVTLTLGTSQYLHSYNGDGVLVGQRVNGALTRYAQDLQAPLSQVLQTTGATTATYLYGLERLAAEQNGARSWYIADALGSVRATTDNTGALRAQHRYDPWGTPQLGSQPQPFGFTGELHDPTLGLVNLRARWYDTSDGRFGVKDPFGGWPEQPYSQHKYQYANANPVQYIDPTGKCVFTGVDTLVCAGVALTIYQAIALVVATGVATYATYDVCITQGACAKLTSDLEAFFSSPEVCSIPVNFAKGGKQKGENYVTREAKTRAMSEKKDVCDVLDEMYEAARLSGNTKLLKDIEEAQKFLGCRNKRKRQGS